MKLILGFFGSLAVLAFAFVGWPMLMVSGGAFSTVGGNKSPGAAANPQIVQMLTLDNAGKRTRLTSDGRKAALDQCIATFRAQRKPGVVDPANTEKLQKGLQSRVDTACRCLVGTIADASKTLEFVHAMAMNFVVFKDLDEDQFSLGDPDNMDAVKPIAANLGISDADIRNANANGMTDVIEAFRTCKLASWH